jgi:hypothetical protein
MSEELLSVMMWVLIVALCAVVYRPAGDALAQATVFSRLTCYLTAYGVTALVIACVFLFIRHGFGGKLLGSDIFGRSEYYLGMAAGGIRYTCILMFLLAFLNARYFSPAEVRAMEKYQNDEYGSNYFPTLHTIQSAVFERSLVGPIIRECLSPVLIARTETEDKQLRQKEYVLP